MTEKEVESMMNFLDGKIFVLFFVIIIIISIVEEKEHVGEENFCLFMMVVLCARMEALRHFMSPSDCAGYEPIPATEDHLLLGSLSPSSSSFFCFIFHNCYHC